MTRTMTLMPMVVARRRVGCTTTAFNQQHPGRRRSGRCTAAFGAVAVLALACAVLLPLATVECAPLGLGAGSFLQARRRLLGHRSDSEGGHPGYRNQEKHYRHHGHTLMEESDEGEGRGGNGHCLASKHMETIVVSESTSHADTERSNNRPPDISECACMSGHSCELVHDNGVIIPCAAGTLQKSPAASSGQDDRSDPLDRLERVPPFCPQCRCVERDSLLREVLDIDRVIFVSVPRSGNGWMRKILELATGIATETVFPEQFTAESTDGKTREVLQADLNVHTNLYSSACGLIHDCDLIRRDPAIPAVIVKSHYPFIPSHTVQGVDLHNGSDVGVGGFHLLPVRNPLDNWEAWNRYLEVHKKPAQPLHEFLPKWVAHHTLWQDTSPYREVPKYVYRFEDLTNEKQRGVITRECIRQSGLAEIMKLDNLDARVSKAIKDPRVQLRASSNHVDESSVAHGFTRYTTDEILAAIEETRHLLERFNYYELYTHWLEMRRGYDALLQTLSAPFQPKGYAAGSSKGKREEGATDRSDLNNDDDDDDDDDDQVGRLSTADNASF